jgi:hypothetical protein
MPTTINAPGFWNSLIEDFINKKDSGPAIPDPYPQESRFLPNTMFDESNKRTYNRLMGLIEGENRRGELSYNLRRDTSDPDQELLDSITSWIRNGGSKRIGE